MIFNPSYLELHLSGELEQRVRTLNSILDNCSLCPRECGADRRSGELGVCSAPAEMEVSSAFAHFGEEPPITGIFGSGTIFLTHCNLRCAFCQNFDISQERDGQRVTTAQMAEIMLNLQQAGCHNINFVTPTHYAPQIIESVSLAASEGLRLPIVWNCGGYESLEVVRLLDGIVDIYMPDLKFFNSKSANDYCNAPDYPEMVKRALLEMHRQVGPLKTDSHGIAQRGLLIRHLVMPGHRIDTRSILKFIATEISKETYVNIMDQYRPLHDAYRFAQINRRVSGTEYNQALRTARELGLSRGF